MSSPLSVATSSYDLSVQKYQYNIIPQKEILETLIINNLNISRSNRFQWLPISKNKRIVHNLSLRCSAGESLGILGLSGSGKSTILSFVAGRLKANSCYLSDLEEMKYNGSTLKEKDLGKLSYFIPCQSELLPFLSAKQSVVFEETLRGRSKRSINDLNNILKSVGLAGPAQNRSVNGYITSPLSVAELRKLGLALSVTANAKIVLFDEPTSYVSETKALEILKFITTLTKARQNSSIVTLHQPTKEQLMMLDKIIILSKDGEMIFTGAPSEAIDRFAHKKHVQGSENRYIREVLFGTDTINNESTEVLKTPNEIRYDEYNDGGSNEPKCRRNKHLRWLNTEGVKYWSENLMVSRDDFEEAETIIELKKSKEKYVTSKRILALMERTFFFRLQNPIVLIGIIIVMIFWAFLFGAVFFDVRGKIDDAVINDPIILPDLSMPSISNEASMFIQDWVDSFNNGVGPEHRKPWEDGGVLPKEGYINEDYRVIIVYNKRNNQLLNNDDISQIEVTDIQNVLNSIMDTLHCASFYWRIIDRHPLDYHEVLKGTYYQMFEMNDIEDYVKPKVTPSSFVPYVMDRAVMTVHELLLVLDYLLTSRSNIIYRIRSCSQSNTGLRVYTCARTIFKELDGLLICAGLPGLNPINTRHSPWETVPPEQLDKPIDGTLSSDQSSNSSGVDSKNVDSIIQFVLSPVVGGISLGAGIVFILAVVAFGMLPIIVHYWTEREVSNRDTIAKSYSTIVFFLCKSITDFIFEYFPVLILSIIFCLMIGLAGTEFGSVQLMVLLLVWAQSGLTYLVTAACRCKGLAMSLFSVLSVIALLFCGFMLRVSDMPDWCAWWRFLSPLYWAYGGCICVFFKPVDGTSVSNLILLALGVTDSYQKSLSWCSLMLFTLGFGLRTIAGIVQIIFHRDLGTQSDLYSN